MADQKAKQLKEQLQQLQRNRMNFDAMYDDIEEVVAPSRGVATRTPSGFTRGTATSSPGTRRRDRIYDSTGVFALEQFAALLASQLTNSAIKWLNLRARDEDLNTDPDVSTWLAMARDQMLSLFNVPETQFHTATNELYLDQGGFGTGIFVIEELPTAPFVMFRTWPVRQVYVMENARGELDTFFIIIRWNAEQAAQFYSDAELPSKIREAREKEPTKEWEFLRVIRPRKQRDRSRVDPANKPIESIHVSLDESVVLRESGFDLHPVIGVRAAKLAGEEYGRGPAMNMLPDIQMLQRVMEVTIRGAQLAIAPPLQGPDEGIIGPVRMTPHAMNYIRQGSRMKIEPIELGARPDFGETFMENIRKSIFRGFFLDPADLDPLQPRVTATAVLDRRDERFRRLAPLVNRMQVEFLSPLVERVLRVMIKRELIPPPPEVLIDREVDVVFTSPAAQAQLVTEAEQITRFLVRALPIAEADPSTLDRIDGDEVIKAYHAAFSVAPQILRSDDAVDQIREQRNAQRQASQDAEQFKTGAEGAERLSKAVQQLDQRGQ